MGTISTESTVVTLTASQYGTNCKALAAALVELCGGTLTLDTVTTDTTSTYDATYNLSEFDGVQVQIRNSSTTLYFATIIDGLQIRSSQAGNAISSGRTTIEVIRGTDWGALRAYRGTSGVIAAYLIVTDYFYGHKILCTCESALFAPLYGVFRFNLNGVSTTMGAFAIGPYATNNGVLMARPLCVYYGGTVCGFVGGLENLYIITNGASSYNTGDVTARIQVGGHTFAGGSETYGYAIRLD